MDRRLQHQVVNSFPTRRTSERVSVSAIGSCEEGISATKVRGYVLDNHVKLEESVPKSVYKNKKLIETFIKLFRL